MNLIIFRYTDSGILSIYAKCFSDTCVNTVTGNWADSILPKNTRLLQVSAVIVKYLRSKYTRLQVYSELANSLWFSKTKRKGHESRSHCQTSFSWIIFLFTAVGMIQRNGETQWKLFHEPSFIHCMAL